MLLALVISAGTRSISYVNFAANASANMFKLSEATKW
jgi:hypothetical protein